MESSRLPRKLLRDVAGATVIRRCVDGLLAQGFQACDLVIVTDSEAIESEIDSWSLGVCCAMRKFEATCGSQRIHEFLAHELIDCEHVLIWQADEIIDSGGGGILRNFFEGLPSGASYNFFSDWALPQFPESGVQVCGSDWVAGFSRARSKAEKCAGLHVGVYLLDKSVFTQFSPSIWDYYEGDIEMNALVSLGYPLRLRELPINTHWHVIQINTADDLDAARSVFLKKSIVDGLLQFF